ncbi:hypothetical protein [Actinocorallia libanotica]|uniref:PIN domain-containing protein n=1 Tax=Actinocorallia libanotica TaxID=46162 RepID=A0ABN1QGT1_9ACTN
MKPATGLVVDHSVLVSIALGGRAAVMVDAARTTLTTIVVPTSALATALLHDDVQAALPAQNTLFELLRWEQCVSDDLTVATAAKLSSRLFGDDLHEIRGTAAALAVGHTAAAAAARGLDLVTCRADLWQWYAETGVYVL